MFAVKVAVVAVLAIVCVSAETSCYADIANPNLYFATKTSYKFIKNTNTDEITLPGCEAVQMWLFSRHGTRYPRNDPEPGGEDFRQTADGNIQSREMELDALTQQMPILRDAVVQNHESGRGELCAEDVQNLRGWTIDIPPELEEKLAPAGEEEMHDIGDRYTARLPGLLDRSYKDGDYTFRFTTASRAEKSCHHFAKGVWGNSEEDTIVYPEPIENDPLIRFYKVCTKWTNEVDNNTASRVEWQKFIDGPEVAATVAAVSKRLGFVVPLSYDQVSLTYTMCRYDKALYYGQLSPWCAAFSNSDLLVLEYVDDLLYYYKDGYGFEINWMQACNPVVDVANYFNSIVTGATNKPYGIFYFSHSGAMAKLLARWGLYNDTIVPTASNFAFQSGRQWSTSRMQNFGVNMVFVLFRCELNTYKVQLYVNERLTHLPGCAQDTCLFSEFAAIVKPIIETCDLDAICENPPAYF